VSTLERVRQVVASVLRVPAPSVEPTARLVDLAELDSLSLAEIAAALDEEFAVRVPGDDLTAVQTVAELAAVVERAPRRGS
jgi:acyl carrier protein